MKYKVGDKVVLRDDLAQHKDYGGLLAIPHIRNHDTKRVVISEIDSTESSSYYNVFDFKLNAWLTDDMIDHEKTATLNNSLENIVAEKNNREHVDAIEPAHYRQGNIDRIEVWYQTYPFEGFRWAMKSHIDKYIHRYESKGGVEDLDKATYFIKRLKEKEMEECSN